MYSLYTPVYTQHRTRLTEANTVCVFTQGQLCRKRREEVTTGWTGCQQAAGCVTAVLGQGEEHDDNGG